ncbi:MAG: hypothetical protein WCO35_00030 [Candidatus Nomurabacteria bacterium]
MKKQIKVLSSLTVIAILIMFLSTGCSKTSSPVPATPVDPHPNWSKVISSVTFTGPATISKIVPGQKKSMGTVTINATGSSTVKLVFTFSGAGASAVADIAQSSTVFVVSNNKIEISIPVNSGLNSVNLNYDIATIIPTGVGDGAAIFVALTSFAESTDIGVNMPGSGNYSNTPVALDVISIPTVVKASTWFAKPNININSIFQINQNAQSDTMKMFLQNTSAMTKSLVSMTGNFGTYGSAVKMLRYKIGINGLWNVLTASAGTINFTNLSLPAGYDTLFCIFAIKASAGVADNSSLSFTISSIDDGAGMNTPTGGTFPSSLNVGSVDAITQATTFTSNWIGYMGQIGYTLNPNGSGNASLYHVTNLKFSGPGSVLLYSMRFKNPYYGTILYFDNSTWSVNDYFVKTSNISIPQSGILWNQEYVSINFPSTIIFGINYYNQLDLNVNIGNTSSVQTFDSDNYTPGVFGLQMVNKYDLVLKNSTNQVIDLSDAVIQFGNIVLPN